MPANRFHTTPLSPELVRRALALLASRRPGDRRAAAQILAQGYAEHEEARLAGVSEADRPDEYDELADPAH